MYDSQLLGRSTVAALVLDGVHAVLERQSQPAPRDLGEASALIGRGGMFDSLGIVTLIVELEEQLELEHDLYLTLANDKALSQRHSPFRTVGTLTDYICALIAEEHAHG